jgi:1,4-dihydroxy-2-naphthoate octaprenyltransferase
VSLSSSQPVGLRVWVAGARPRTLGAVIAPVVIGTAAAVPSGPTIWWRAACALGVGIALQVGVNYANDYSDGVRGTDANRKGPIRLTATGLAKPEAVKRAAFISFGVAAAFGLALAIAVDLRLLIVGIAAIAAAWLYTGGPKPYGYSGLGELMVLVFFGFVATCGSCYVQISDVPAVAWYAATAVGLMACAVLLANNIRDVPTDIQAHKRTLAVRIGAPRARMLFVIAHAGAYLAVIAIGLQYPWALLGLLAIPLSVVPVTLVMTRTDPPSLVRALVGTGQADVALAVLVAIGLAVS